MKQTVAGEDGADQKPSKELQWLFVLICCAPLLALRASMLFRPLALYDFIFYWAAGHLFLTGSHP